MITVWTGMVVLGVCLCVLLYLALRARSNVSLKLQRRALAFVLIAGVLAAATQMRNAASTLIWRDTTQDFQAAVTGDLLFEVPAVLFLLLAARSLLASEREEVSPLTRSAMVDPLTSLHSQAYFRRAATRRVSQSQRYEIPLSLGMLDIDDFKSYNDSYGREAGNGALRTVAGIVRKSVRADDLVARYGGEEFVVLLNCDLSNAGAVFERVRSNVETLSDVFSARDENLGGYPVTVSIGLSGLRPEEEERPETSVVEEILEKADAALERAKKSGKNRVVSSFEAA